MQNENTLFTEAKQWIGVREKKSNSGFNSVIFERKLLEVGWYKYAPWCAFFTKMITIDTLLKFKSHSVLEDAKHEDFINILGGSVVITWSNLNAFYNKDTSIFEVHQRILKPNSIAFFRYGKTSKGHAVIVGNELLKDAFETIEGNSNVAGAREGVGVFARIRKNNLPYADKGLNILGSITLKF